MLNCLTYIAFVYWAVATVHTVLPVDVAVCGADAVRGGLGALFKHAFGGDLDVDVTTWAGFPCNSGLLTKLLFILRRPAATVRHIMYGGGQDEPFVPILFVVPLVFFALVLLRRLGLRFVSEAGARTFLKFGVAVGCRTVIILHTLAYPTKESVYFKRYSKVEFCIIAWTAYIIELPAWHETLVSGGTALSILVMCSLFPHHMLPEVNPITVAMQGVAGAVVGVGHAYYLQRRRRIAEGAARAARAAAKAAAAAAAEEEEQQLLIKTARQQHRHLVLGHGAASISTVTATAAATTTTSLTTTAAAPPAAVPSTTDSTRTATQLMPAAVGGGGGVAASLAVLRRMRAMACRSYVSPARPCRFSIKIQHAHLSDLPPDVMSIINGEVLVGSGWQAVSAHAREGCVELILDLRPLIPVRTALYGSGGGASTADDRRAQHDQDKPNADRADGDEDADAAPPPLPVRMDPAALRDLARSIVSYLHHTGVIQPDREQSIVLQMDQDTVVMMWQPEAQIWATVDPAAAAASSAPAPAPPALLHVSPRVAVSSGVGGSRLLINALLVGPSAEEVLAGGGVVVRSGAGSLPYSVLHVQPQAAPAAPSPSAAVAAPPPLLVELAVFDAPVSGLLLVEARTSSGLLSAPLAVVVDCEPGVVSGLTAVVAAMDDVSADAFLRDFGTWLDAPAARAAAAAAARATYDITPDVDGFGGKGSSHVMTAADVCGPSGEARRDDDVSYHCDATEHGAVADGDAAALDITMLAVAADLLSVCCQGAGANAAIAAAVDRLIGCVMACDGGKSPADALAALLDAIPAPPTGAGALHLAVAAGSRPMVQVLLRWHERLYDAAGAVGNPWLSRASCGVTPLHVAAAMPDDGAMAAWLLTECDVAAASWAAAAAASDDGLTPAALAAQLGGVRRRLRLWYACGVARAVRRHAAALSPPLARAGELLFGFRDASLERRYVDAANGRQTVVTLALYAGVSALLPLLPMLKAAMLGSSGAALAALAFHLPHAAPLLAWLCRVCAPYSAPPSAKLSSPAVAVAAKLSPTHGSKLLPSPSPLPPVAAAAAVRLLTLGGGGGQRPTGAVRLQGALLVTHLLCRAAAKAAAGLSLWPFALPRGSEALLARGGDIALEAVVRPLLEQVGLPARLFVSLADGPATWLLYRGLQLRQPGLVPGPLRRTLLYQVVLLATTATVSATNRARFLRSQKTRWVGGGAVSAAAEAEAAVAATGSSVSAASSPACGPLSTGGGGGKAGRVRPPGREPSGGALGGKGADLGAAAGCVGGGSSGGGGGAEKPRIRSCRAGDDQMAGSAGGAAAAAAVAGGGGCRAC